MSDPDDLEAERRRIQRWIKKGKGQGRGRDYQPWLRVRDVSSSGLSSRIKGWTSERIHHLLSEIETNYFYCLEWADRVIEVREQFPLLPLDETLAIAKECGIEHPSYRPLHGKTKVPIVMTTDFLITTKDGLTSPNHARTVKPASELADGRVIEKLELERRYWQRRYVDWGIVTERDIPKTPAKNIHWIHNLYDLTDCGVSLEQVRNVRIILEPQLTVAAEARISPINALCGACDDRLGLNPGDSLTVVRHLLARKIWKTDMNIVLHPGNPLRLQAKKAPGENRPAISE
jgi:hypothetical protein